MTFLPGDIERVLPGRLDRVTRGAPARLREAMAYGLLAGGKRMRPLLVMASHELFHGTAVELALDFACALEMVHTYSLLHDDLPAMDNDDLRRGRPTCHKVYGEAMAILAGDGLLTAAFQLLAEGDEPSRGRLCALLARAAGADGMVGGQADDMRERWPAELSFLESLHARKTGALIAVACVGGATIGGASADALGAMERYGRHLGLAFQIADDLLDVTGDAAVTGKSSGNDERNGKTNFVARVGIEAARERARFEVAEAKRNLAQAGESLDLAALADFAISRVT